MTCKQTGEAGVEPTTAILKTTVLPLNYSPNFTTKFTYLYVI